MPLPSRGEVLAELHSRDLNNAALKSIVYLAEKIGWPIHWASDLLIDRTILMEMDPPEHFGWILRECGTHIIDPRSKNGVEYVQAIAQTNPDSKFFWWNGSEMQAIQPKGLEYLVSREYAAAVQAKTNTPVRFW